jgi:cytochrome b involved in lipid metabolism
MQDVMSHNRPTDAWTAVNGRVYDITNFLNRHPGGYSVIARAIGKDGTEIFKDGHPYSNSASTLARFEIGRIKR